MAERDPYAVRVLKQKFAAIEKDRREMIKEIQTHEAEIRKLREAANKIEAEQALLEEAIRTIMGESR